MWLSMLLQHEPPYLFVPSSSRIDHLSRAVLIPRSRVVGSTRLAAPITPSIVAIMLKIPVSHYPCEVMQSTYLPPQSLKSLFLRLGIDPRADDEGYDVEERHPSVLRQELLGKSQCHGRDDPAHFHDGHKAGSDGRSDLVEGPGAGDDCHGSEVDGVLDGCNLQITPCLALLCPTQSSCMV